MGTRNLNDGYLYENRLAVLLLKITDTALRVFRRPPRRHPDSVTKILIIKPDHLGDVLMASSVIPVLAKKYSGATIDCVCGSWTEEVARRLNCFARLYSVDHVLLNRSSRNIAEKWVRFLASYWKTLKSIRKEKYDLCLCLRPFGGNLISLAALSGAKFISGHGTAGGGPLLDATAHWLPGKHIVQHHLEVLATCGCTADFASLRCLPLSGGEDQGICAVAAKLKIPGTFHVIIPGSGAPEKMFQPSFWKNVASSLQEGAIVVCGSPAEEHRFLPIAQGSTRFINAMGKIALHELQELYARSLSVHSTDSFGAHLAAMSGANTTVYYKPEADIAAWHPLGDNCRYVVIEEE